MNKITIAGIRRGNIFSPNHIGNDEMVFSLTAMHLRARGCTVNEYSEREFFEKETEEPFLFNMVRDTYSVKKLQHLEDEGRIVINSGYGIENCTREKMTRLLISHQEPSPVSLIVKTSSDPVPELEELGITNCWIKRGDFHAIHREDVTYVRNHDEVKGILKEYAIRGIKTAVINEHLIGDLVKFYGVADTDFFYWFYPSSINYSKFGMEQINGNAQGFAFDLHQLKRLCKEISELLNVKIYGGDCIVSSDGSIRIIDFNDWPSFAPCREVAAPKIAECIYNSIMK